MKTKSIHFFDLHNMLNTVNLYHDWIKENSHIEIINIGYMGLGNEIMIVTYKERLDF